jgi:hypothetical protein
LEQLYGATASRSHEAALLDDVAPSLRALSLPARLVVADGPLSSLILARAAGRGRWIVPPGQSGTALSPLLFDALLVRRALPPSARREEAARHLKELGEAMGLLGIRCVGEFADLHAAGVVARFGATGAHLHAIASGREPRQYLEPHRPVVRLIERVELEAPVEQLESVLFVLNGLFSRLLQRSQGRGRTLTELRLGLGHPDGKVTLVDVAMGRPAARLRVLVDVCQARLAELGPLPGPVEWVEVEVRGEAPARAAQFDLLDRGVLQRERLGELVPRLMAAMGEKEDEVSTSAGAVGRCVGAAALDDRYRPEVAWHGVPMTEAHEEAARGGRAGEVGLAGPFDDVPPARRPLRLLDPPRVLVRRGDDVLELDGRGHRVVDVSPVERMSGEWWGSETFARDYFEVCVEGGGMWWVFADRGVEGLIGSRCGVGPGAWHSAGPLYLHGFFD